MDRLKLSKCLKICNGSTAMGRADDRSGHVRFRLSAIVFAAQQILAMCYFRTLRSLTVSRSTLTRGRHGVTTSHRGLEIDFSIDLMGAMDLAGWIVRTESSGRQRYWKVGERDPDLAAQIAGRTASADTAKAISKIAARPLPQFGVTAGVATEIWECRRRALPSEQSGLDAEVQGIGAKVPGEITFDTVLPEEGARHVEGCFRIDGEDWKVYYLTNWRNGSLWAGAPLIRSNAVFQSGISGVCGVVPDGTVLNKKTVMKILALAVGIEAWREVSGPNSLILK
jgi:hypothetical protein